MKKLYLGMTLLVFLSIPAPAQLKLRTVVDANPFKNQPVLVVDRRLGRTSLNNKAAVEADTDWIKDVRIDVKNVSNKPIMAIDVLLVVDRQGEMKQAAPFPLEFRAAQPGPTRKMKLLSPGETVTLLVMEHDRRLWMQFLRRYSMEDIREVSVQVQRVYFGDGTAWMEGREMRQNPDNPDQWDPVRSTSSPITRIPPLASVFWGSKTQEAQDTSAIIKMTAVPGPVGLVSFNKDAETLEFNRQFPATSDWFKNLSFNLFNSSKHPVTYIEIAGTVFPPKQKSDLFPYRYLMMMGNVSKALNRESSGLEFPPASRGESSSHLLAIGFVDHDKEYASIRRSLDKIGYPEFVEEIEVHVSQVVFKDGSIWSMGKWLKRDPDRPGHLIEIGNRGDAGEGVAQRQDTKGKEIKKRNFSNEPIQILEMSSNGNSISFEEVFVDDNWLKDFSFNFKNVSKRTITFIYLSLDFPETRSSGRLHVHSIRYGVAGAANDFRDEDLRALPSDGVDTITLRAKSYESLKTVISQRVALSDLTSANVSIERVEFADGTHWGAGDIFQPDPAKSHRDYKQIVRSREPNEPLEIVGLQTDRSGLELGRRFSINDKDWLKGFTVTYLNKAPKAIASATIYLAFPETMESGSVMMYPLPFGPVRKSAINGERSVLIQPGESFTVSVDAAQLTKLKNFLNNRHSLDSLSKVELSAGFILFDDGTAWSNGSYRIQDPNRPGVWVDDPKLSEVKP